MRIRLLFLTCFLAAANAFAQEAVPVGDAVLALKRSLHAVATRQWAGGWGSAYTRNGTIVWGEWKPIPQGWITVQPPATPVVAGVFLRAARVLGDSTLALHAALARDALVKLQTEAGGFPHEGDPAAPRPRVATFDDQVTTAAMRFLIDWWHYTGKAEDRALAERVGNFLLESQYEVGGWPQAYPPASSGYARDITFNDGVMVEAIRALLTLHRELGDDRYLEAARKAGACIIRLQGGPGEAVWAQQYDPVTLEPAWARAFEPPGYSAGESVGVCDVLIDLYRATGDVAYLDPLPKAFEWYDTHRLENGLWARLYEPGTQRPVYGRRDKPEKVYEFENACSGYGWQAAWYPASAKATYETIQQMGENTWLEQQRAERGGSSAPGAAQVRKVIDALSADGFWVEPPDGNDLEEYEKAGVDPGEAMVRMGTFVRNAKVLLDYIEANQPAPVPAHEGEG